MVWCKFIRLELYLQSSTKGYGIEIGVIYSQDSQDSLAICQKWNGNNLFERCTHTSKSARLLIIPSAGAAVVNYLMLGSTVVTLQVHNILFTVDLTCGCNSDSSQILRSYTYKYNLSNEFDRNYLIHECGNVWGCSFQVQLAAKLSWFGTILFFVADFQSILMVLVIR